MCQCFNVVYLELTRQNYSLHSVVKPQPDRDGEVKDKGKNPVKLLRELIKDW